MKILIVLFLALNFAYADVDLRTIAEKGQWKHTGRAVETEILCKAFQKQFPKEVNCKSYGKTPEGRELLYIVVGERNSKKPVLWVESGIHAGEIDGKDAVFWLMKDIFQGKTVPNLFKDVTMVFIPIVNVDGHERFGKWNRPNQVGPEEMGWRTTAQNLNMNRDFMKADAPEMQALIKLWVKTNPTLSLDLHVTDGAQFRPEIGIIVLPTTHHGNSPLHEAGKEFENGLMEKMKARDHLALPFYPSFEEDDKPSSGFSRYVSTPRFSQGYWFVQNRLGALVETHSWKDYATRVKAHYSAVLSSLEMLQQHGKKWMEVGKAIDGESLVGKEVSLSFKHSDKSHFIEFPGYKYKIEKSELSGGDVIRYFTNQPEIWKVPFFEEIIPKVTVKSPRGGYFIPPTYSKIVSEKLALHGIRFETWKGEKEITLQAFRAQKKELSPTSFEGHQTLTVEGKWEPEKVTLPKGTLFVPIDQKKAYLLMHLLEPMAPDSLLSWGFFNAHFEQKEYMETYVTEDVGRQMLKDEKIRAEFKEKLKDKEFAKDEAKRFEFFYRKHPSWDTKFNLYPIFRM